MPAGAGPLQTLRLRARARPKGPTEVSGRGGDRPVIKTTNQPKRAVTFQNYVPSVYSSARFYPSYAACRWKSSM